MSKKVLTIAAGLVITTSLWGMMHLAAFQDAIGGDDTAAIDGKAATSDETDAEIAAIYEIPRAKPRRPLTGAEAEFSRRSERDAERRLNELMQTVRVGELSFPGDNSLPDILESLSLMLSDSQGSPILIRSDVMALSDNSVVLSDVIIKDITISAGLMSVGSALDHILSQTDPKLTWIAKDELLLITTKSAAESDENMFLRSYDVSRLRQLPLGTQSASDGGSQGGHGGGGFGGGGGGGFSLPFEPLQFGGDGGTPAEPQTSTTPPLKQKPQETAVDLSQQNLIRNWESSLLQIIQDMSRPSCRWFDIDGEGGKLSIAGNRVIVLQSRKGHQQIVAVLEQLEMAAEDAAEEE